jgi:hypothetical protein
MNNKNKIKIIIISIGILILHYIWIQNIEEKNEKYTYHKKQKINKEKNLIISLSNRYINPDNLKILKSEIVNEQETFLLINYQYNNLNYICAFLFDDLYQTYRLILDKEVLSENWIIKYFNLSGYDFISIYGSSGGSSGNIDFFIYKILNFKTIEQEIFLDHLVFNLNIGKIENSYSVHFEGKYFNYILAYNKDIDELYYLKIKRY